MVLRLKSVGVPAVAGVLLALAPAASAENITAAASNPLYSGGGSPGAMLTSLAGAPGGIVSSPGYNTASSSPYSSGYGGGYYEDPYAGFLRGTADVVRAQGNFLTSLQQSNLMQEYVRQAKVETRRRIWDEWDDERRNTPSLEDLRERTQAMELRRALHDPPLTEVWSGKSLNDILDSLKKAQGKGPSMPIDPDVLKQINVNSGGRENIGLIRNVKEGAPLNWPLALRGADLDADRASIDRLLARSVSQAVQGPVDAGNLTALGAAVRRMQTRVGQEANDLAPTQYIESRRFLSQLEDAVAALGDPNAANYFSQKYAPQGKTVGELVNYMATHGLRFAPAVAGDQAAYLALHHYLASYSRAIEKE
jgi:hypothetical protein